MRRQREDKGAPAEVTTPYARCYALSYIAISPPTPCLLLLASPLWRPPDRARAWRLLGWPVWPAPSARPLHRAVDQNREQQDGTYDFHDCEQCMACSELSTCFSPVSGLAP